MSKPRGGIWGRPSDTRLPAPIPEALPKTRDFLLLHSPALSPRLLSPIQHQKKKKKGRKQNTVILDTRKAGNPNADQHAMY
jgi:hypothetical protein